MISRTQEVEPNGNIEPARPEQVAGITATSDKINLGGIAINKTALYVAGGALAIAVLLKVLK